LNTYVSPCSLYTDYFDHSSHKLLGPNILL